MENESILSNLHLYEIVFLIMGSILFLILCIALIYSVYKQRDYKMLLAFFILPIIMIAYPTIQEFQFAGAQIKMKESIEELNKNPDNTEALSDLEEATAKFESRANSTSDFVELSVSYEYLGDDEKSKFYANKAKNLLDEDLIADPHGDPPQIIGSDELAPPSGQLIHTPKSTLDEIENVGILKRELIDHPELWENKEQLDKRIKDLDLEKSEITKFTIKKHKLLKESEFSR